jgi:hypothetical protein
MFRAEVRNLILSSMAHQWLINLSSIAHQSLINRSSIAHILFWIIFSFGSSSFGSSPLFHSALFQSLLGLSSVCCVVMPRTARVHIVFCAVYLTTGAFLPDTTAPPASPFDGAPADGGKARNKAAARRQRVRQSARADISQRLQRHVDLL